MVQYSWDSITPAQALAFTSADTTFSTGSGGGVTVVFDDAAERVTVTDSAGRSVVFGGGVYGARLIFANDGRSIQIGSPRDDFIDPESYPNVFAGAGNDTLVADAYQVTLSGGPGSDLFALPVFGDAAKIIDWEGHDSIRFSAIAAGASNYLEATRATESEAATYANGQIAAGAADYVAVQVGADVLIFADANDNNGAADSVVRLVGRTLADISADDIVGGAAPTAAGPIPSPPPSQPQVYDVTGRIRGDMDAAQLSGLVGAPITIATSTRLVIDGGSADVLLTGEGFTYNGNGQVTGGQVKGLEAVLGDFSASLAARVGAQLVDASQLLGWTLTNATQLAFSTILAGNDSIEGGPFGDLIRTYAGNDLIQGYGGANTIFAGAGDDRIYAYYATSATFGDPGACYLRGDDGDDVIVGGVVFDDINGNLGNDTCSGGLGDDWVVGGKDQDLLYGQAGADLVYGNLGNDTCEGGDGSDIVRGGQGNDVLNGGTGSDYVSGDRGEDTVTGGTGADIFHTFGEAGLDRVTDFTAAEGDRVQLDPGTQFTVAQVGADTVISMTGGGQMVLVGVQVSSLPQGWIFGA